MSAKRDQFRSPDVCEMVQVQPYVLRSWEAEFPGLGQPADAGGGRVYRRADVELVLRIKQMVFGEGLTLAGARRRLEEEVEDPPPGVVKVEDVLGDMARTRLRQLRKGLEAIMALVSRDIAAPSGTLSGTLSMAGAHAGSSSVLSAGAKASAKRAILPQRPAKSATKLVASKRRRAS
jgi:DNA-binding transcriptional MerR regulator